MRMRSYSWFLAVGLAAGGLKLYLSHPELHQWFRRHQFQVEGLDQAVPSQVYFLETNRWLEFDIPQDTPLIRLISNASVHSTDKAPPGTQWPYAIEYQLRGRQDRTISTGIYHFKGEQLVFLDRQSGQPVEVNSYLERRFIPLGGRRCILNLEDPAIRDAQCLRLRLHSNHPDLAEVAVRVYFQSKVPERKIAYLWNRLSEDQRRDLARGNVYSIEGLTDHEKRGLLRYRWDVAAPEGIPGRDFERRVLYIRDDSESLEMLREWVPSGIVVDTSHRGVLPMTNAPGICEVRMLGDSATSSSQIVSNTFRWYGEQQQTVTNQFTWSGTNRTVAVPNREGFWEIGSSRPIYVRAFQANRGETNEITPEPASLLTFTVCPTNSVAYAVDHLDQEPTFFRVDLRRRPSLTEGSETVGGLAHYALLTGDGGTVKTGEVALTNTCSAYDWLVTTNGLTNITAPQSLCFVLPPAVRLLRISSPSEPILVNAYSRPAHLIKMVLVPEDYSPPRSLQPEQPNWFTVLPPDHIQRRVSLQYGLVRIQARLPEFDPLVLAGQYEWESFLPEPAAPGQMILLPPAEGQAARPESLPFSYFPVPSRDTQHVRFRGQAWERQVAPSLMLIASNRPPGATTITVDGQTLLRNTLETPVTQIRLGDLTVGEHEIRVQTRNPVSAYLSHLESATQAAYLQRFCIMATSNALHFPYVKRERNEEVLVLRVFSPVERNPQPFEVRVRLKPGPPRGLGPFSELTWMEREARVTPNPVSQTRLVAATPASLDDGRPLFLRMGSDLAPGRYEIEVAVVAHSPRWLSLSRTTPGLMEKLELASKRRAD